MESATGRNRRTYCAEMESKVGTNGSMFWMAMTEPFNIMDGRQNIMFIFILYHFENSY